MKKLLMGILGLAVAMPVFVSVSAFAETAIDEININSSTEEVYAGPLGSYTVTTSTGHISIGDYGSNTNWAKWEEGHSSWHGFGSEEPSAVADGSTHYAMRLEIDAEDGYEIVEQPSIIFNGSNITESGYTQFSKMDWGGYLYIDLGTAQSEMPQDFVLTYDFNGGATFDGQSMHEFRFGTRSIPLNEGTLISCFDYDNVNDECHALDVIEGKTLAYVAVNGERHDLEEGDDFLLDQDTTIVYYWEGGEETPAADKKIYEIEDMQGNVISFLEQVGQELYFEFASFNSNMTDKELDERGIDKEFYHEIVSQLKEALADKGTLISFLEIDVWNETIHEYLHENSFDIKILYTEEMEGFDSYKLYYIDFDNPDNIVGQAVELKLENGFLVGTLPHLSAFVLVGETAEPTPASPETGASNSSFEGSSVSIVSSIICGVVVALFGYAVLSKHSR